MKSAYFLSALTLVPLAPAHALPATAAAEVRSDADALVAQLVGNDAMVALGNRAFDAGLDVEIAADPATAKIYAAHPGLKQYVVGALRGEFVKVLLRELPTLRRQISTLVAADLDGQEIADTLTFFRSPAGKKVMARAYAAIGDKPGQTPEQVRQAAMSAVMSSLAPEDYPALMAFGASGAAQKMQVLNPKIATTSQAWASKLVADNEVRMRTMAAKAVSDFLSAKKPS